MNTSDHPSDELANEAIRLKLPPYIVNSFIATGYDTLDVIADLTDKDITEIEAIIKDDFVGDDRFVNHATVMHQICHCLNSNLVTEKEYINLLKRPSTW